MAEHQTHIVETCSLVALHICTSGSSQHHLEFGQQMEQDYLSCQSDSNCLMCIFLLLFFSFLKFLLWFLESHSYNIFKCIC